MSSSRLALLTTSCLAALVATAPAQRSNLKRALPADTIAFFTLPDLDTSVQEFLNMPLSRMWRQKELQDFLAPGMAEVDKQWKSGLEQAKSMHEQGELPFSPQDLLQLRLYGASAALTQFRMVEANGQPMPEIGFLAHLDFGPSAPMWKKVIGFGLEQLERRAGDELAKSTSKAGEVEMTSWQTPGVAMGLNLAWVGDGIVVGSMASEVTAALTALASKTDVLTEASAYKAVAANVQNPAAEVEMFFNFEAAYSSLFAILEMAKASAPDFPPELSVKGLDRAFEALGLKAIKAVGATSTYEGTKAVSKGYLVCPAPERRGLLADGSKNLDLSCLNWVPKKATACSATTLNITAVWDSLVNALKAYDPELADGLLGQLGQFEEQLGFTMRDDLCGSFGSQMLSWSTPIQGIPGLGGGSLINGMFLVQMKDKDRLLKCLKGIKEIAGGQLEFDSNTRDDLTTYYVKLNIDLPPDIPFNPLPMIQPVFAFQSDYMVLGFSRADVRKTVKAMAGENPEDESIRANKEFAAMLGQLKPDRLTSVSFSDNRASFDNIYELAYGLSYMVPEDFPLDVQQLPDEGSFLSQHVFPSVSYSYTDGNGFSSTHSGPFGPELVAIVATLAATAAVGGAWVQRGVMARRR